MNRKKLQNLRGRYIGLRPLPLYLGSRNNWLPVDNNWYIREATTQRVSLQAVETERMVTPYLLDIETDHIHEYRTASSPAPRSGILVLHSQIYLRGTEAWLEPISHQGPPSALSPRQFTAGVSAGPFRLPKVLFFMLGGALAYGMIR
jgi:hypothetical protein